jgi:transcriptional regulator with XRE-family HTH domain
MREDKTAEFLGRRIRSVRKSRNLTQEQLGERSRVSYKHLGAIERGEENPSLSVLQKIAKGLGVEISELFSFQHEETDSTRLEKMINDLIKDEKVERLQLIMKIVKALK